MYQYHTCIRDEMNRDIPLTSICRDHMKVHFSFSNKFAVDIPERDHWLDECKHSIPVTAMTVFNDGSRGSSGVGAGISFNGLSE